MEDSEEVCPVHSQDLGLRRQILEEQIQEMVGCMEELEKMCAQNAPDSGGGSPEWSPDQNLEEVSSIICSVVFDCRFDYQDEDFKTFLGLLAENMRRMGTFWVQLHGLFLAFLRHLPGFEKQKEFGAQIVREHEVSLDTAQPWHFIDAFLIHVQQLREKYRDVFTVYLGLKPVVMLCGTEVIREALVDQTDAFSGRRKIASIEQSFQGYGVIFTNGNCWKTLRRFSLATMRDFGMGKRSVEECIQEEAQCLVEELRKSLGDPDREMEALLDPTFFFHATTANIIYSIVFGERFAYKDPQFLRLLDLFYQSFTLISFFSSQVLELSRDFLKRFPGPHRQIYKNTQEVNAFIDLSLEKHRETLDPSAPRDFINTYLLRLDKENSNPDTEFRLQNLILTELSLFFAGPEITSTTLRYGCLLMLKYLHIKVHEEIDDVIGSHRPPALEDGAKMPYTDAVIHEIQRFADLLPVSLPHTVTKDTHFRGHTIPKAKPTGFLNLSCGTEVVPILSTALYDPHYFEKPGDFNPDHFLDANGALKKNEAFMPFSIGKCICLGEGIPQSELFLFFTTVLQNFSLARPAAPKDIDITPQESGVIKLPPVYQIHFLPR
ncbi:cytochrome P450 2B4-like [Trichechus manatus latirostris]|uniref:Cytochrome P450 n=1 Tax=Trichechus manatus latirostris TaxID=127582 RepID=A0A2Y9RUE3_TRIMA|nr:cytochrome P450 2B4-like [Trichechus manatus latirostris]